MRVRNISDKPTADLKARGLVNATVALGGNLLAPGEVAEVPNHERQGATFQKLLKAGVLQEEVAPKEVVKPAVFTPPPKGKSVSEDKGNKEKE